MTSLARITFAALCLLASIAPLAAQTREPEAVVRWLYERTMKDQDKPVPPAFDRNNKKRQLLSQSLDTLWKRADKKVNPKGDELGAMEFDVVSNSQDPNIKSYVLQTESRDEQRATIATTFTIGDNHTHSGQKDTVRYDFVREKGAWKIDNVRLTIEGKPWEMRAHFEALLRNCIGSDRPCPAPR
jgi:hypothetical protein